MDEQTDAQTEIMLLYRHKVADINTHTDVSFFYYIRYAS